jgi:hypothetical protein
MRKPYSGKIRDSFYDKIEELFEAFEKSAKEFARKGDERDSLPEFIILPLQEAVKESNDLTVKHRNELLSELRKKSKEAVKINDLSWYHQRDMEQGLSGSEYHRHLADLESALGM